MFRIGFSKIGFVVFFSFSLLFMAQASGAAFAVDQRAEICRQSNALSVNETIRDLSVGESEIHCFSTFVPEVGYWALEATVPGSAPVEPRLDFYGAMCESSPLSPRSAQASYRALQRTASSIVIKALVSGLHTFCVASQDPQRSLGNLRIENRFMGVDRLQDGDPKEIEVDPDPTPSPSPLIQPFDGDPKEIEVDPDPTYAPSPWVQPFDGDPKEIEVDPDPTYAPSPWIHPFDGDPKEIEVDPDPTSGSSSSQDVSDLRRLCMFSEVDDHDGLALCATPLRLGRSVTGTLEDFFGDDQDLFVFELNNIVTVEIEMFGPVDIQTVLYDLWGQRLAQARDGDEPGDFRLVKTLPPGRYLLRVASPRGTEGAYRLILRHLDL